MVVGGFGGGGGGGDGCGGGGGANQFRPGLVLTLSDTMEFLAVPM